MRRTARKLLVASLLTLYGGIALLGYGLHALSPVHSHGNAPGGVHAHSHARCTHHHQHSHAPIPDRPGCSDAHECDICYLLDQVRSEKPQLAAIDAWQPFVDDVVAIHIVAISEPTLGLHKPRGPPREMA